MSSTDPVQRQLDAAEAHRAAGGRLDDPPNGEWRIKPEDDGTFTLTTPEGKLVMRCYPDKEFAVAIYLDLLDAEVQAKAGFWFSRIITVVDCAKTVERLKAKDPEAWK